MPFLIENGLDAKLFFEQLFDNKISSFFGIDVIVSSLLFWLFVYWEGSKLQMRYLWIYPLSNILVGVSFGLPLFLFNRHHYLKNN
jgi:hypothetical protein